MKLFKLPSMRWHQKAQGLIAQGALTNSKRPECLVMGVYPTHLVSGRGCFVTDTEGKKYIDFICGLGSSILGYANDEINEAIFQQARLGATLSLSSEIEIKFAEKVREIFPFIDRMKILKTGSDACTAAIRIARAFTGRKHVVSEGYHGWHDEFISLVPPGLGVMPHEFIGSFKNGVMSDEVAAVIIEPVSTVASKERIEWVKNLRKECDRAGIVLIFDEVITGFRHPKFSFSNYHGVRPDLICLGKAMANGMPVSVVGGREDIMNCGEYFVSSTFAGETLSLAAGLRTMTLLQTKYHLEQLWSEGEKFQKSFNEMWPEKLKIEGYPTRGVFKGEDLTKALFWQESVKAGLLFGPSWFFNFPHIDQASSVLSACSAIFQKLKTGKVELQGQMPSSPFAQRMREQK